MSAAAEAQAAAWYLPKDELLRRPKEVGLAIDPTDKAEIDDAVNVTENSDGTYRIAIHIADAGLLWGKSAIIEEAREKGWSWYAPVESGLKNDLMIPEAISLDGLGLDRNYYGLGAPAVTIACDFDPVLRRTLDLDIFKSRVYCEPIDYARFSKRISNDNKRAKLIVKAARLINQDIDTPSDFSRTTTSKDAVAELMIAGNRLIAEEMRKHGIPWLYRNHKQRIPSTLRDFDASQLDITVSDLLDTMGHARYSSTSLRHQGLNLSAYCHFTSPLRRFADLVNHLTLHALFTGKPLPFTQEQLDEFAESLTIRTAKEVGALFVQAA